MKIWGSIDEAANDLGITTRSVYRQIESGKIRKQRGKGGGWVYVEEEDTDVWRGDDVTDDVTSDLTSTGDVKDVSNDFIDTSVDVSDKDFVSGKERVFRNKRVSQPTPIREGASSLVQGLRDELESAKIQFEVEKLQDAREKWTERKDGERKERIEKEQVLKLGQFQMEETQRRREEEQRRVRHKIQIAKAEALEGLDQILPSVITANVLQEIEGEFLKLKVDEIPSHELVTIAKAIRDKVFQDPIFTDSVRESLLNYAWQASTQLLRNQMKKLYQQAVKQGRFNGSYADWLGMLANRYPEDGQKRLFEILL
jgi:hypothetical protein